MATKPKSDAPESVPAKSLADRRKDRAKQESDAKRREKGFGRYLMRDDGKLFNYTHTLAARTDMREVDENGKTVHAKGIEEADEGVE